MQGLFAIIDKGFPGEEIFYLLMLFIMILWGRKKEKNKRSKTK